MPLRKINIDNTRRVSPRTNNTTPQVQWEDENGEPRMIAVQDLDDEEQEQREPENEDDEPAENEDDTQEQSGAPQN
jgi:hypothetical protein